MTTVVFCDLDSTLCDTRHRQGQVDPIDPDWLAYSMECGNDELIAGTARLLELLSEAGHQIVLLTSRRVEAQRLTVEWLDHHGVTYDALVMQGNDGRHPAAFKVEAIKTWLAEQPESQAVLALDDWDAIAEAIEAEGIPVVRVRAPLLESEKTSR